MSPPRSPSVVDVVVMVAVVVASAVAVRLGGGPQIAASWHVTAGAALVCALAFGIPALAFTLERGLARPAWMVALGAIGGALPLLLLGGSGIVGLYVRSGRWERVSWALERGMPLPAAGIIYWPRFARLEVQAILLGACCGFMVWLLLIRARPDTRALNILLALFALATMVTMAALLR